MVAWFPLLMLVLGLVIYALPLNAKVTEIGRIMFFCGLLALCFSLAGRMVRLL